MFPEIVEQFSPADWQFLGSPVDYVIFDGLTRGFVDRVVLVEVKTGAPRLSDRQAQIQSAVDSGAMPLIWRTLRLPKKPGAAPRRAPEIVELPPDAGSRRSVGD